MAVEAVALAAPDRAVDVKALGRGGGRLSAFSRLGAFAGGFGLVANYTFDTTTGITLRNGAVLQESTAPWLTLPTEYGYGTSDVGLTWTGTFPAASSKP